VKLTSKYLENAVDQLASLPGIGKKTALRLVLNLLNRSEEEITAFTSSFQEMKLHLKKCIKCGNITDEECCVICSNDNRDQSIICVVEDIRDVIAIEGTGTYKGIYHVLGGVISPMDGIGPSDLNINSLIDKTSNGRINEIIFALSPTMEGDTTNYYLYKKLNLYGVLITTLSRGVSIGTELQYADENTLGKSLLYRHPFQTNI
jgi:recombination protein RecR